MVILLWILMQVEHGDSLTCGSCSISRFFQPREDPSWYWSALMAHGPSQSAFHVRGNEKLLPEIFFSVFYQFPDVVTSIYHIHIFTTILSALLGCNVVRDDCLKCCLLYFQFFMQFKMNTCLWFILSCTHPGQSQQPNLTAWNVCQVFPPFSGNSLLPSCC